MDRSELSIGFFDSGVGGISVLKEAVKLLPNENYIYFGDSKNAPYGIKSVEEVRELSFEAINFLVAKGVKAIVVACNTATSAAIEEIRKKYSDMPIVGIEPALKPAVEHCTSGRIIIMATPMTLAEKKFKRLQEKYNSNETDITPMPCGKLVEFVEGGITSGPEVEKYLREKLAPYMGEHKEHISSIVLGCTHFPFIKETLQEIVGNEVNIIDGSNGTSRQLKKLLTKSNLLNKSKDKGKVEIYNSSLQEELVNLSYKLLNNL